MVDSPSCQFLIYNNTHATKVSTKSIKNQVTHPGFVVMRVSPVPVEFDNVRMF